MVRNAKAQMTPEQTEGFKSKGRDIYSVDYTTTDVSSGLKSMDKLLLDEAVKSLKLGCDREFFTDKEIELLTEKFGDEWEHKFKN